MFEKAALIVVAVVGGYGAITGTLPAALIALFGNPSALTAVKPSINWYLTLLNDFTAPGTGPVTTP